MRSLRSQVCDDSTDEVTRTMIDESVSNWSERGVNISVMRRGDRVGYKSGALSAVSLMHAALS